MKARERRKLFSVERGKNEMMCDRCGVDEAVRYSHTMTQMEAFKPCQSCAGNLLCKLEELILMHFSDYRALRPSIAASRQQFKVRNHRHPTALEGDAVHPCDRFLFPPEQIHEDGRFNQTIMAGHRVRLPNAGEAATQT